jgi:hypothetical protein
MSAGVDAGYDVVVSEEVFALSGTADDASAGAEDDSVIM